MSLLPAMSLYPLPPPSPFLGGLSYPVLAFTPRLLDPPRVEFRLFLEPVAFAAAAARLGPDPPPGDVRHYFALFLASHAPASEIALLWRAYSGPLSGPLAPPFFPLHSAVAVDHPELPLLVDLFAGSGFDPLASCGGVSLLGLALAVVRRRGSPSPGFLRLLSLSGLSPPPSARLAPPAPSPPPSFQPLSPYWSPLAIVAAAFAEKAAPLAGRPPPRAGCPRHRP